MVSSELASLGFKGRVSKSQASTIPGSLKILKRVTEEHNVELPTGAKKGMQRNAGGGTGPRGFSAQNRINRLFSPNNVSRESQSGQGHSTVVLCSSCLKYISNTDSLLLSLPAFVFLRVIMYRRTVNSGEGTLQCNEQVRRMNIGCNSRIFVEYPTSLLCRLYMASNVSLINVFTAMNVELTSKSKAPSTTWD